MAILDPPFLDQTSRPGHRDGGLQEVGGDGDLREAVALRIERLVAAAGHDADSLDVRIQRKGEDLRIELVGPTLSIEIRQAIAVRVLDVLRSTDRTYGNVEVDYRAEVSAPPRP